MRGSHELRPELVPFTVLPGGPLRVLDRRFSSQLQRLLSVEVSLPKAPSKLFINTVKGFFGSIAVVAVVMTGFTIWPPPGSAIAQGETSCYVAPPKFEDLRYLMK